MTSNDYFDAEWLRDKYTGKSCIVVGNGPSLADVPLSFLKSRPSIASNYIHLLEGFQPTFYTISSYRVIEEEKYQEWVRPIVRGAEAAWITKLGVENFPYPNVYPYRATRSFCFSYEPHRRCFTGANSTVVNLQFAFWMGFTEVLLVGVDHNYKSWDKEKAHFVDGYPTVRGTRPILEHPTGRHKVDMAFLECARAFEAEGRRVYNLSPKSALPFFPHRKLEVIVTKE